MSRMIGVLGGSFDPPHIGHLRPALEVRQALGLEKVILMPAGRHPFKSESNRATPEQRLEMTRIATQNCVGLSVSDLEVRERSTAYTVNTLAKLSRQFPDVELVFLMGTDLLEELHLWKSWQRLLSIAHLAIMTRPGFQWERLKGQAVEFLNQRRIADSSVLRCSTSGQYACCLVPVTPLSISSSALRSELGTGGDGCWLIPDPVRDYISTHDLYVETDR
ncbi:MAG: nicotinate (nicotinamide) nucleotide adenylyltransferase [Magnetococcales bacterium]|nr:nicotinate (nicotinamide) nucleotide adenylyltransferase [Magnetococcales bacterium]